MPMSCRNSQLQGLKITTQTHCCNRTNRRKGHLIACCIQGDLSLTVQIRLCFPVELPLSNSFEAHISKDCWTGIARKFSEAVCGGFQLQKLYQGDISACQDVKHKHVLMRQIKNFFDWFDLSETFTLLCDQHEPSFSYAFQTNLFTNILMACSFSAVIHHSSACIMCLLEKVNRRNCSKVFKKFLVYPFFIFSGEVEKTLMTQAGRLICPMASVCIRVAFNRKKHSGGIRYSLNTVYQSDCI